MLVPVALRNSYVGGGFFITTSQFGPNLYIGNHPGADGSYESLRPGRGAPEYERQDATELAEHALGRPLTPGEVSGYWTDRAIGFMTSRPAEWLRLMARKVALVGNATEMLDTESQESHAEWSWPLRLGAPFGNFGVLIPLALFGVVLTWPMRSRLWVLYVMTVGYAASVVLFYVFARYRYPLAPFLIVFAAVGLIALPSVIRTRAIPGGWRTIGGDRRGGGLRQLARAVGRFDEGDHREQSRRRPPGGTTRCGSNSSLSARHRTPTGLRAGLQQPGVRVARRWTFRRSDRHLPTSAGAAARFSRR